MKKLKCINNSPMFFGGEYQKMQEINDDISIVLKIGEVYTVNHIDTSSWFNKIYLNEIQGFWFGIDAFEEI